MKRHYQGREANYRMNNSTRANITAARKGRPAPNFDEPIRAAIARQAAAPLPKDAQVIYAAWNGATYDAYANIHEQAQALGWGNDYTIRIENTGLKAYKNTGK
jgi:hypothetical protein